MTRSICAGLALLLFTAIPAAASQAPHISIIIDDLGYQLAAGKRAAELPGPVACAILPGTPRARDLAELAHHNGKEVLVHLPMQAVAPDAPLSPGSLTLEMTEHALAQAFSEAMRSVPFAVGVNNHQGSLVTRHPGHMRWLMERIREHELDFFVDSYTTHKSVALKLAAESDVAALKRDVFLDADPDPARVLHEFERLKSIARKQGQAIGIGHPYPATLDILEQLLPELAAEGFRLVPVRDLLEQN